MSISITCSSCGLAGSVPDTAAGKIAKCKRCETVIKVPAASAAPAKFCVACGVDVSGQKRTKDTAGRYYCQPCWQAKLEAGQVANLAEASAAAAPASSRARNLAPPPLPRTAPRAPVEELEELDSLETCPQCQTSVLASDLVLGDNEQMVCKACAHAEIHLADDLPDFAPPVYQTPQYATPRYAAAPAAMGGARCVQHPGMPAVAQCRTCGTFVCPTCVFSFPGGVHLCPACATKPVQPLSGKRKGLLIAAYALAIWTTLGMALVFSGALRGMAHSKTDVAMLGLMIIALIFVPAVIGTILAWCTLDKRLGNTGSIWGAVVWNSILISVQLLIVIGSMAAK